LQADHINACANAENHIFIAELFKTEKLAVILKRGVERQALFVEEANMVHLVF
jgi:hypothetical protein